MLKKNEVVLLFVHLCMRKLILIIVILLCSLGLYGQKVEVIGTHVAFNFNSEGWSDFKECLVPIVFYEDVVLIKSEEPISFRVFKKESSSVDEGKQEVMILHSKDNVGEVCEIWVVKDVDDDTHGNVFIFYPFVSVGYRVEFL